MFKPTFSNLNTNGDLVYPIRFEGLLDRKLGFNHGLLFLSVVHRLKNVPIDFESVYDELKLQALDEMSWTIPGLHFLILQKIPPLTL